MLEHLDTIFAFAVILAGVSLLVTVLVQLAEAFLALRGSNLRWGIRTLLTDADPLLGPYAEAIAEGVLHHPLISDSTMSTALPRLFSRWRLATTIHKDELMEILRALAQAPSAGAPPRTVQAWQVALQKSFDRLAPAPAGQLLLAVPKLKAVFADDPDQLALVLAPLLSAAAEVPSNIERWFDPVMDRVSQRFTQHARLWTVIFSVLLALALHLDSFQLLTQLSTDSELRARLISSADALTHTADETLARPAGSLPGEAMKKLIAAHPAELGALDPLPNLPDFGAARTWLTAQLRDHAIAAPETYLHEYDALIEESFRGSLAGLRSLLDDKLKFRLVPDPYPVPFYNYWTPSWLHLWGVIASAALLSLGAPFWFNVLKTLGSLRPSLARKEPPQGTENTGASR